MTLSDDFRNAVDRVAADTEDESLAIYAAYIGSRIELGAAVGLIAARINAGNAVAVTLADTYVVSAIEELGEPATSVGLLYEDQGDRLAQAANTILTEPSEHSPEDRLTRLSQAEPFQAAQTSAVEAMSRQPLVEGWQRHFESAKPCQLCVWIARIGPDGPRVWPAAQPFQVMHPGDKCVPKVVLRERIQSTVKTRRLRNG